MYRLCRQKKFHDGTERPIPRARDAFEQTEHYSGKKHHHTVKNVLLVAQNREVKYLSRTYEGRVHDKLISDEAGYTLPHGSILYQDKGFQGFEMVGVTILQPTKKPQGADLSDEQKNENREISSIRMLVEHTICDVKRCRVLKEKCRLWSEGIRDLVMLIACGLHNFRIKSAS